MINARYKHTNIVARDWKALSKFYQDVFGCVFVPPLRDLSGDWLSKGAGVADARFVGGHFRLPGHGSNGPTLEIYQYSQEEARPPTAANREGIMHLAFEVADVQAAADEVVRAGGSMVGQVVTAEIPEAGLLTWVYVADPEGNIIELQAWR
jgi:predicted enzyme related to lactoylglutathione lyase